MAGAGYTSGNTGAQKQDIGTGASGQDSKQQQSAATASQAGFVTANASSPLDLSQNQRATSGVGGSVVNIIGPQGSANWDDPIKTLFPNGVLAGAVGQKPVVSGISSSSSIQWLVGLAAVVTIAGYFHSRKGKG